MDTVRWATALCYSDRAEATRGYYNYQTERVKKKRTTERKRKRIKNNLFYSFIQQRRQIVENIKTAAKTTNNNYCTGEKTRVFCRHRVPEHLAAAVVRQVGTVSIICSTSSCSHLLSSFVRALGFTRWKAAQTSKNRFQGVGRVQLQKNNNSNNNNKIHKMQFRSVYILHGVPITARSSRFETTPLLQTHTHTHVYKRGKRGTLQRRSTDIHNTGGGRRYYE